MESYQKFKEMKMRANDSEGNEYSSIQDMWIKELDPNWKQMEID